MVNRTITLYHVTMDTNHQSIALLGLLTDFNEGKNGCVWLVKQAKIRWAIRHIGKLRKLPQERMIIIAVTVRRSWLRKTSLRGVWCCTEDICPKRIQSIRKVE